jgi:hypothetical protein
VRGTLSAPGCPWKSAFRGLLLLDDFNQEALSLQTAAKNRQIAQVFFDRVISIAGAALPETGLIVSELQNL